MKSGWEGGGWLVSEQYLSLKTRLTKFVSSLKKREICFFPFLKGRNSKNKTLPLFSKDLKLFNLKKKKKDEIGNEIHGCFHRSHWQRGK